jgi:iron complex outermembrane recepter protein
MLLMLRSKWLLLVGVAVLPVMGARAAETDDSNAPAQVAAADAPSPESADDAHPTPSQDIVVTAPYARDRLSVLSTVAVLSGATLTREVRGTIGETLTAQAGVSATSFGPNASRPVLRGFQGERIRVLTDGIGSFDVSNTSVDHAVVVNPLLAERIEVLHGPTSLLYGSSAIGGVVNIIDTRIPRHVPDEAVHIDALGSYGTAANEFNGAISVDVPLDKHWVAHVDGSYLKSSDLKIGGYVLSEPKREEAIAAGNPVIADLRGTLPNSAATTWNIAGGIAYIGDSGSAGIAVSHYDNNYGVPIRYASDPSVENDIVHIAMHQTRVDARAEFDTDGDFIERIKFRYGFADYQHSELDPQGDIGTTFLNQGMEGRLELTQATRGIWKGALGAQIITRDFDAIGDEAFVPRNSTLQIGAFALEQFQFGTIRTEFSGRIESSQVSAAETGYDRSFVPVSGSAGVSVPLFSDGWRIGLDIAHTERAPSSEELLANGPHGGTQAYEIGDPNFRIESSNGVEAVLRGRGDGYTLEASAYYDRFSNYIYEDQTGQIIDALPVFQARQADAIYWGFEIQGTSNLAKFGDWTLTGNALADYVNATLVDLGPVPRIPPFRVRGGLDIGNDAVVFHGEAEYGAAQNRVSPLETTTPSYTLVNASATWTPWQARPGVYVVLAVDNIFDVDARRAASFLKDYAPLPGRDVRLSFRVTI